MFKKYKKYIFALFSILIIFSGTIYYLRWKRDNPPRNDFARQRVFLYKTDYYELRDACIKVIKNRHSYKSNPRIPNPSDNPKAPILIDPEDESLPEPLLKINPSNIVVTDARLVAHFHHGPPMCCHCGIVVFLDENNISDIHFKGKEKELLVSTFDQGKMLQPNDEWWIKVIPNLWYFDYQFEYGRTHGNTKKEEFVKIIKEKASIQNKKHND